MGKIGRPSKYTPELAARICEQIAAGRALSEICNEEGMPCTMTVLRWLESNQEFRGHYAWAREAQGDLMDKLIMEAATAEPERVIVRTGEGTSKEQVDGAEVQHRRLKIDALKWRAAHLRPKVYGVQRQEVEHKGSLTLEQLLTQSWKTDEKKPDDRG